MGVSPPAPPEDSPPPGSASRSTLPKPVDRWLSAVSVAVGLVLYLLPKTRVGVVCCIVSMFGLLFHPVWNFWWVERALWRRGVAVAFLLGVLVLIGHVSWPVQEQTARRDVHPTSGPPPQEPQVYRPFLTLYRRHAHELGAVGSEAAPSRGNYIGVHENAIILWLNQAQKLYVLDAVGQRTRTFSFLQAEQPSIPTQWHEPECLKLLFPNTPAGLWPPWGDVAIQWHNHPEIWRWIGYRKWHCGAPASKVFVQLFATGVIAGPFRSALDRALPRLFVIFGDNDSKWDQEQDQPLADLPCVSPEQLVFHDESGKPTVPDWEAQRARTIAGCTSDRARPLVR